MSEAEFDFDINAQALYERPFVITASSEILPGIQRVFGDVSDGRNCKVRNVVVGCRKVGAPVLVVISTKWPASLYWRSLHRVKDHGIEQTSKRELRKFI